MLKSKSLLVAVVFGIATLGAAQPASAQSAERNAASAARSAQAQAQQKRARTQIRVTPRCPYRSVSVDYPVPYECEFPGPGFVRQCQSWLAPDYRPSGTVIMPHMRCFWVRG